MVKRSVYLSTLYRGVRDLMDRNQPLLQTPWGFRFSGNERMASGAFESGETDLVRELLQSCDLFLNAGANTGYYVCHALSMGKRVIAIEPIPRNVHYLMKNVHANNWQDQVEIFPVAAGAEAGIQPIWGGGTGASLVPGWAMNSKEYVNYVPVLTLDRIVGGVNGKRVLILVDVEGYEYPLLMGAKEMLNATPSPVWLIEITKTEHQPDASSGNPHFLETFQLFLDAGYNVYRGDGSWKPVSRKELEQIDRLEIQSPCINYLFLRDQELENKKKQGV